MEKIYDVTALGELLIDFTDSGRSSQGNLLMEANPGGAPCNVLAMLKNLGHRCAFIGKVGDDIFGHLLKKTLDDLGIASQGLHIDKDARTTLAFVKNSEDGDREFSFFRNPGADMLLQSREVDTDLIRNARIFHFGTLSLSYATVREATRAAVETARENGVLISFDPNLRESLWDDLSEAKKQMEWGLSVCDILKIADNEAVFLTGEKDPKKAAALLHGRYPQIRMCNLTLGAEGSYHEDGENSVFVPACRLGGTIETTGAGDVFCACILHYVLEHGCGKLTKEEAEEMLSFANAAAYLITTRKGALRVMPKREEIETIREDQKINTTKHEKEE